MNLFTFKELITGRERLFCAILLFVFCVCFIFYVSDFLQSPLFKLLDSLKNYLSIYSAISGLSCTAAWGLLSSCGVSAPEHVGSTFAEGHSLVAVCRLSCPVACGIFLEQQSNLYPLHWQVDFLAIGPPGKPWNLFLK